MNQKGFTLIELVVVIVVLGILAAVAVPKFVDLSAEADTAAVKAVAGALGSASAINFAAYKASNPDAEEAITCADQADLLDSWDVEKYSIKSIDPPANGDPGTCNVFTPISSPLYSANFTAFYVSN